MAELEPGSFKDPAGRVFYHGGQVLRTLSPRARATMERAFADGLIPSLVADGLLVGCRLARAAELELDPGRFGEVVLVQDRVELVSYPYEWSFDMLRDAALLTLSVQERCLAAGYSLKDGTAFNVLFHRNRPVLVDVLSVDERPEGAAWAGYGQFCRSFLFPLLIASRRRLEPQRILRGYLGEIPLQDARRFFGLRDLFAPGVLKDVLLQARLDRSFGAAPERVQGSVRGFAVPAELLLANVRRLAGIIRRLDYRTGVSEWGGYASCNTYSEEDAARKAAFVEGAVAAARPDVVVDLGANTGTYSDLAARHARRVVSVDVDPEAVNELYRRLGPGVERSVLVADLANPSPGQGWALRERKPLGQRVHGQFFLALALVHHLRIGCGVPFDMVLDELAGFAPEGVIEWVGRDDEMVRRLLSLREDVFDDLPWERFEELLRARFEVVAVAETHGGNRRLCHVRRGA